MKFNKGDLRLWIADWSSTLKLVMVTSDKYGYEGWLQVVVIATGRRCQVQVGDTLEIKKTDIICPLQ